MICGLSGGVDSSVAALLVHRAVGEQLTCVFVDHGLMRLNEAEQVVEAFEQFGIPLVHVEAEERFLAQARRASTTPSASARSSARSSSASSRRRRRSSRTPRYLVQGTLYSDVIESGGSDGADDDQVPPQRRRPARGPRVRAGRAAADAVQGRGAGGRRRARPARADGLAPALPGPGPGDPHRRRRGEQGAARHPPRRRRDPAGGDPRRRALPPALAVLLRAAGRALGRRPGRRPHLRLPDRDPRRHLRRRDDRRLGPAALRPAGAGLEPDHQRDPRRQPRRARHLLEAARPRSSGSSRRTSGGSIDFSGRDGRACITTKYKRPARIVRVPSLRCVDRDSQPGPGGAGGAAGAAAAAGLAGRLQQSLVGAGAGARRSSSWSSAIELCAGLGRPSSPTWRCVAVPPLAALRARRRLVARRATPWPGRWLAVAAVRASPGSAPGLAGRRDGGDGALRRSPA